MAKKNLVEVGTAAVVAGVWPPPAPPPKPTGRGGARPGSGRKPLAARDRRTTIAPHVAPATLKGIARLQKAWGVSQGKVIDRLVAEQIAAEEQLAALKAAEKQKKKAAAPKKPTPTKKEK